MIAHGLTPILNVSSFKESVEWFEKLGWQFGWGWGEPPAFGGYVGASFALLTGTMRPRVGGGVPMFVSDGLRFSVRAAGGLEWIANRHFSVMAEVGAPSLNVTFNVTAQDAQSFRRSEGQIAAMLNRVVGRGGRNL